jgi:hypothetical protein
VIVPIANGFLTRVESFVSSDGGQTFTGPFTVSSIIEHTPAGNLRALDVPTADVDASGKVYMVWSDCRFRTGCSSNDLVLSTSTDGQTWTAPARIPVDAVSSTVDHFLTGISVKPGTSRASAALALAYYFYPNAACTTSTCQLNYGVTVSMDGGASWSSGMKLAGPFMLPWLPFTTSGFMVGDYSNTTWPGDRPETVFAIASEGNCQVSVVGSCHEPMAAIKNGPVSGPFHPASSAGVVVHAPPTARTAPASMH